MTMATDDKRRIARILSLSKDLSQKVRPRFDCYVDNFGGVWCENLSVHDDRMHPLCALAAIEGKGFFHDPHEAADAMGLGDISSEVVEATDCRVPKGLDDRQSQTQREVRRLVLDSLGMRDER